MHAHTHTHTHSQLSNQLYLICKVREVWSQGCRIHSDTQSGNQPIKRLPGPQLVKQASFGCMKPSNQLYLICKVCEVWSQGQGWTSAVTPGQATNPLSNQQPHSWSNTQVLPVHCSAIWLGRQKHYHCRQWEKSSMESHWPAAPQLVKRAGFDCTLLCNMTWKMKASWP